MTLGEIIDRLKKEPEDVLINNGFYHPHSYRGYYERLAFKPKSNVTIKEMIEAAESAIGQTFTGYKGGEFVMDRHTECYIAERGCCGEEIGERLLNYMLEDKA